MKSQSKKEKFATDKGIHRDVMLEMGVYNIHKEKAYKDKSKYNRKNKRQNPPEED